MNTYLKDLKTVKNHLKNNKQGLTVSQISKFLNVNRNSVAKYMDVLLISGQVEMRQIGPAKLFILSSTVPTSNLLDYSNDGMIFLNYELEIIKINKKILDIFETKEEELIGNKIFKTNIPFFKSDTFLTDCQKTQEIGSATNCCKLEIRRSRKYYKYRFFKTIFENGQTGFGLVITDVTLTQEKEATLKFRVKFEELIATIATDFIGTQKNETSIEIFRALKKIGILGEVDRSFIYLFSKDLKKGISPYHWSKNPINIQDFKEELNLEKYDRWISKFLDFELIYVSNNQNTRDNEKKYLKTHKLESTVMVPLISQGNLVGCLGVAMETENRFWSEKTTSMLTMCAKVFVEVFKKFNILEDYYK